MPQGLRERARPGRLIIKGKVFMSSSLCDYLPSDAELKHVERFIASLSAPVLEYWPAGISGGRRKLEVFTKSDGSKVSSGDLFVHAELEGELHARFPRDVIVSEEGKEEFPALENQRAWVIDPIDGTSYFISGSQDFAILVALVVSGVPIVSWLSFPALGIMIHACVERGVWWNGTRIEIPRAGEFDPRRIHVRKIKPPPGLEHAITAVAYVSVVEKLCRGEIDGAIFGEPGYPWDLAAPLLAFTASGLTVSDMTGAELRFCKRDQRSAMVVAAPSIHGKLIDTLAMR